MNLRKIISKNLVVKNTLKKILHIIKLISIKYRRRYSILNIVADILPNTLAIDVGASYYPHPAFEVFRRSPNNTWVAIEPNEKNLFYLNSWNWPSQVVSFKMGLSQFGGPQTLFVTNIDSGSSLLKPNISSSNSHRIKNKSYFFPVKEVEIDTITLKDVFEKINFNQIPFSMKLDTQGSEFSILKGLQEDVIKNYAICVELENTLLSDPIMEGSAPFFEVLQFFQENGFELVHLKPIQINAPRVKKVFNSSYILNECDAVFLLSNAVTKTRSIEFQLAMLGAYISYSLYGEAHDLALYILENSQIGETNLKLLKKLIKSLSPIY